MFLLLQPLSEERVAVRFVNVFICVFFLCLYFVYSLIISLIGERWIAAIVVVPALFIADCKILYP